MTLGEADRSKNVTNQSILPSWRDGPTRATILDFFDQVDEIPPSDRVAVFDNDGTMWAEKPNQPQVEFILLELHSLDVRTSTRPFVSAAAQRPCLSRGRLNTAHFAFPAASTAPNTSLSL
jgi:hypothetical protein